MIAAGTGSPPCAHSFEAASHRAHRRLANRWASYLLLKILPTPLEIPAMGWGAQWHQYRDLDPGTKWMCELIQRTARAIGL